MKYLYEKIAGHWQSLTNKDEIKILQEYGEVGRTLSLGYIISINVVLAVYLATPQMLPLLLDVIDPLNETRTKPLMPTFAEYFIDEQKYYYQLNLHCWTAFVITIQMSVSLDATYTQCVQHTCALFAIVEYRIKTSAKLASSSEFSSQKEKDEAVYNSMVDAIKLHKEAIGFVDIIEDSYSLSYFFLVIINTLIVSFVAVIVMLYIENGNTKQSIRFAVDYFGFELHMLYNMCPGQRVIDSSTNIQNVAFQCDWFNASPKTKTLIKIVMLRSEKPCQFTAGKLIVLNLENFASVFKKSLSYVTVVGSMR